MTEKDDSLLKVAGETIGAIVFCNAIGGATAIGTSPTRDDWFESLEKPSFQPPNWVFGPAWTILYSLMGVSLSVLWRARGKDEDADSALALFGIQLAMNSLWSFLFFRWKSPGWALVDIVGLFVAIVMTLRAAWKVSPLAGALLIPYLVWVGFATVLNFSIWRKNR